MKITSGKRFGPFEVLEKLGHGGMASVFKACYAPREPLGPGTNMGLLQANDIVALKIANWVVTNEPVLLQRFQNEFKVADRLQHPNLVRALGYGVEDDLAYLVMEYVPGQSLEKRLKEQGPLPVEEALVLFWDVIRALAFVHENKLIHRDIKPGNILVGPDGQGKLADLGLIKDLESDLLLTNSRVGLGTLGFSAPEQFDDAKNVDLRCDIYGLGATLYFTLSGKFPFGQRSAIQMMKRKLEHQFIPLSHLAPAISPALDQIVIRALHPDPAMRPASAEEFLEGMLGQPSTRAVPIPKMPSEFIPVSPDRRSGDRYPAQLPTTLYAQVSQSPITMQAEVLDLSTLGLSLRCPKQFEPGSQLQVQLPSDYAGMSSSHLVHTRWIKQLSEQDWVLGCTFLRPLESEDLDRILFVSFSKTVAKDSAATTR